jgi:hypothetical protein
MTSNLGAEHLLAGMVGNSMKVARDLVMQEVCAEITILPCFQIVSFDYPY